MASVTKYPIHSVGRLFLHNNRSPDDGVTHSNEEIDNSRTENNYFLCQGSVERLNKRLSEVFRTRTSDSSIVIAEAVVTLPKNIEVDSDDERTFFEAVCDFYADDFGEDNIINAVVHKDEKRPHIHLDFVPTVIETAPHCQKGDRRYEANVKWLNDHNGKCERLCAKDAINREYLQTMHERLSDFVEERLGYQAEILNGATVNGNKKVLQLKVETLKEQIQAFEQRLEHFKIEAEQMHKAAQRWGISENDISLIPLMQKIEDLEAKNAVLQDIISREGYRYTRPDLDKLRTKRYTPSKAAGISVFDGSLVTADFEQNAVIVIEVRDNGKSPSPQQKLIESNADLERSYKLACMTGGAVSTKPSKVNSQIYVFLKPENERQTIDLILQLERSLRENEEEMKGRRLYMDRVALDKYDLARSVITTLDMSCNYYERKDLAEKQGEEKTREQQLV